MMRPGGVKSDRCGVIQRGEERGQSGLEDRMEETGRDVCEWCKDEAPEVKAGVGDGEAGLVQNEVSVEKEVEVEGAWSVAMSANPSVADLDVQESLHQRVGRKRRVNSGGGVEKGILVLESDWLGLVYGRDSGQGSKGHELADSVVNVPEAVAEV
jgi:hypothetical protein